MKTAMSTMCFDKMPINDKIFAICQSGFDGIELWTKDFSWNDSIFYKKILDDFGVHVIQTAKIDGWFELDGSLMGVKDNFIDIFDECKRRIELSKNLGADYIVAFPSRNDRGRYASLIDGIDRFGKIFEFGKSVGVIPTIEFISQTSQINSIQSAFDFINQINDPLCKIIVDCFHLWKLDGNMNSFRNSSINKNQISLLHVSDASSFISREVYKDRERVMPGDGIIEIVDFLKIAINKEFDGYVSLGAYNKDDLKESCFERAKEGYFKLNKVLKEAQIVSV